MGERAVEQIWQGYRVKAAPHEQGEGAGVSLLPLTSLSRASNGHMAEVVSPASSPGSGSSLDEAPSVEQGSSRTCSKRSMHCCRS